MSKTVKDTAIALVISLIGIFSLSASAQALPSIEAAINKIFVVQSQQVMAQLNEQLQNKIAKQVNEYTFDFSAAEVEQQVGKKIANDDEVTNINSEQTVVQVKVKNK